MQGPRRSLRRKLSVTTLVTVASALFVVGVTLIVLELQFGKRDLAQDLQLKASLVGANSRAAVSFQDEIYAAEALSAFQIEPDVVEAAIVLPDGSIFADYTLNASEVDRGLLALALASDRPIFDGAHLVLTEPITLDGELIARVYVHADLDSVYEQVANYLVILASVLVISGLLALLVWTRMARQLARPLNSLVGIVDQVTRTKDYSARVTVSSDDELGTLITGFNEMLSQIKDRDAQLREHQQYLERQVDERTAELQRANRHLKGEVLERRRAEGEMRKLSSAVTQAAEPVMITDTRGVIEFVNPAFEEMTGYTAEEAVGQTPSILRSDQHDREFFSDLWRTIQAGEVFEGVLVNRRKDGSNYHEELIIAPLKDDEGEITHFIATGKDISERIRAQQQLQQLAHHDNITGLPNRVLLMDRLDRTLTRARRNESGFAVMFLDLDGFKAINDTLGHHVGDEMLKIVGHRLQDAVRAEDTVARMGGDEFAMILEDVTDPQDAHSVANKVLEKLAQPIELENKPLYVTGSIGICVYPQDGDSVAELLRRADSAMYAAKRDGKNTSRFYNRAEDKADAARLELEHQLRRAAEHEDFLLFYQPQVEIQTGQLMGVEALLRFRHPELGLLDPSQFLDVLEDTGLIMKVGNWALKEACSQAVRWRDQGLPMLRMSVNLSALQFAQGDLVHTVKAVLDATGVDPRVLHLEITESMLVESVETSARKLRELDAIGVKVSVDDFGVGYSSLNYLKRFPISKLKIDQSFTKEVTTDGDDAAIVKAIIALARNLRIDVIAEGVETEEQLDFMEAEGCDEVQGYLLSPPLSPLAFIAWYADNCPLEHGFPHLQLHPQRG